MQSQQGKRVFKEVKKINDPSCQQVQNLFHRNRIFMMKHNIIPQQGSKISYKKKSIAGELTNECLQKLRNISNSFHGNNAINKNGNEQMEEIGNAQNQIKSFLNLDDQSSDQYAQKLHELLSTQESFTKHFVSSDQRINKQIQLDCDKQKQRLMFGSINQSKAQLTSNHKSKNNLNQKYSQKESLHQQNSYHNQDLLQNSNSNNENNTFGHNQNTMYNFQINKDKKEGEGRYSIQLDIEKHKNNGIHQDQILYPKSPSVSFDQYSQRKDLFKIIEQIISEGINFISMNNKKECNNYASSNEYRFNNFFVNISDLQHTIDIQKQTKRKYEVFDCQMSEIKYDNVCEIYQKSNFSNLLTKCLVDYNREGKEDDRVYFHKQKDIPITDLEVENIIKGRQITSPFKRYHSPNFKKHLGREKKINFYPNSTFCLSTIQNEVKSQNKNRRNVISQRGQTQVLQIDFSEENFHQSSVCNRIQSPKRLQTINPRMNMKEERQKKAHTSQGNNNQNTIEQKIIINKRNPLSLFREKRRKIHQMLNIDEY